MTIDSSGAVEILAELQLQTEILRSASENLLQVQEYLSRLEEVSVFLFSAVAVVSGLLFGYFFIRDLLNRFLE